MAASPFWNKTELPIDAKALEGEYPSFPARELIESVKTGETMVKMNLTFDKFYH